jgi:hypothetical protein
MSEISIGQAAAQYWLSQLEGNILKAYKSSNAILSLHKQGARTAAFMLQAIGRMYKTMHNKKRFTKLQDKFKTLEDYLGKVDHLLHLINIASNVKTKNNAIIKILKARLATCYTEANAWLIKSFISKTNAFAKLHKKLNTADWQNNEQEVGAIIAYYNTELVEIKTFIAEHCTTITDMELQVHELRRKLRWLSIYPQALRGGIQLKLAKIIPASLKVYHTKAQLASPFLQLPLTIPTIKVAQLKHSNFVALSSIIAQLGATKDVALAVQDIAQIFTELNAYNMEQSTLQAEKYLGAKTYQLNKQIEVATMIIMQINRDKILDGIVA